MERATTTKAPAPARAPTPEPRVAPSHSLSVGSLIALQGLAGNRTVAAILQRATAAPSPATATAPAKATAAVEEARPKPPLSAQDSKDLESTAHDLEDAIIRNKQTRTLDIISLHLSRKEELAEKYKSVAGAELRANLIGQFQSGMPLAKALAYLHYGPDIDHLAPRMGISLIKDLVADQEAMDLLSKHGHPQRKAMEAEYAKIYNGVFGTTGWVLWDHLKRLADITNDQAVVKARILLLRDLSNADKLYFATHWWEGAQDGVVAILQGVWSEGVPAFDEMFADWDRDVRAKPAEVGIGLKEKVRGKLSGMNLRMADTIFRNYQRVKDNALSPEEAGLTAAQDSMDAAGSAWFGLGDSKQQVKAAGSMRVALDALELAQAKKLLNAPGANLAASNRTLYRPEGKRLGPDADLPDAAALRASTAKRLSKELYGPDQLEAQIALRRKPTVADQIYVLLMRKQEKGVLELLCKAWQDGNELDVEHEAKNPPEGGPRYPYSIIGKSSGLSQTSQLLTRVLLKGDWDHVMRGADYLRQVLKGCRTEDLETAFKFLKGMTPDLREKVYGAFKVLKYDGQDGKPDALFFNYINMGPFPLSPAKADMLGLIDTKKASDLLYWAEARQNYSTRVGTGWMVDVYDRSTGEDTRRLADEALRRLRKYVEKLSVSPRELEAFMAEEGVDDPRKLADLAYEEFKEKLDRIRQVEAEGVEIITGVINFVGRSALVFLTGPGILANFISAIASYSASVGAKKALLGDEFTANTPEFWGNIASEVGASAFDLLKIEAAIFKAVTPTDLAKFGKWAGVAGHGSKLVGEFIKASGSKLFEKLPQNMVEGKDWPTVTDLGARAFHASMLASMKTASGVLVKQQGLYDSYGQRLLIQFQKTLANGPPPKSAPIYAPV